MSNFNPRVPISPLAQATQAVGVAVLDTLGARECDRNGCDRNCGAHTRFYAADLLNPMLLDDLLNPDRPSLVERVAAFLEEEIQETGITAHPL